MLGRRRHARPARPSARSFAAGVLVAMLPAAARADRPVDYDRDVRPILSQNCYVCHGPDEGTRQADLRLDTAEGLAAETSHGTPSVRPGDPAGSALHARITSADPDLKMPPPDSEKTLTEAQVATLTRWIAEGGKVADHWAFEPIRRPEVPTIRSAVDGDGRAARPLEPIDPFVWEGLAGTPLPPSPVADARTRLRRATLDLTGLPPTVEEIARFEEDAARFGVDVAYVRLVDRLLASPAYGEQMGRTWLDAARYGDTHGLHLDNERSLWPYRDWVIEAFNADMPFDRFTVEQLAGDLLPSPRRDQVIATGFNRCNVTTSEGGAIAEEWRVRYAIDRVEAIGTVWLGLTVGCAACHSHKFDPISQREFYGLFAFYNNVDENPMDGNALLPPPILPVPTPEQERQQASLGTLRDAARAKLDAAIAGLDYRDPGPDPGRDEEGATREVVWLDDELPPGATWQADGPPLTPVAEGGPVLSGKVAWTRTAEGLTQHFFAGATGGLTVAAGDRLFAHVYLDPADPPKSVMLQFNDGSWEHRAFWGEDLIPYGSTGTTKVRVGGLPPAGRWVRLEVPPKTVGLKPGAVVNGIAFTQWGGTLISDRAGIITAGAKAPTRSLAAWLDEARSSPPAGLPKDLEAVVKKADKDLSEPDRARLRDHFLTRVHPDTKEALKPAVEAHEQAVKAYDELVKQIPSTLVMKDKAEKKPARILERGEYDKPGAEVGPIVPAVLPPLTGEHADDRLGLARWLVREDQPLTARVTVNRFWQRYFGTGLVATTQDFGRQGDRPSHPELLDWLADEFRASGWDVKRLQRQIVLSRTYQQESTVRADARATDPDNRLLSRGPRHRLDAEVVRDQALAVAGLLLRPIGGRSVRPYQPVGLWEAVAYTDSNTAKFVQEHGPALYRRSMYTFWKRTAPPPTMAIFDAPNRESCVVRRPSTNTPLQALALMNDVQFVEAARHLALRLLSEETGDDRAKLARGLTLVVGRPPTEAELSILTDALAGFRQTYTGDAEAAQALLSQGESQPQAALDPAEWAAWTMVGSLLLNLSETVTKS